MHGGGLQTKLHSSCSYDCLGGCENPVTAVMLVVPTTQNKGAEALSPCNVEGLGQAHGLAPLCAFARCQLTQPNLLLLLAALLLLDEDQGLSSKVACCVSLLWLTVFFFVLLLCLLFQF